MGATDVSACVTMICVEEAFVPIMHVSVQMGMSKGVSEECKHENKQVHA